MPKFAEESDLGQEVGRAIITLITRKKGKNFSTSSTCEFKNINSEGLVLELTKIAKQVWENDVCSQGKECNKCKVLIPNYAKNLCVKHQK